MASPQYNRVIRKLVVGFGNLFDDITLVRYNPDGTEAQRQKVPIAYAAKERYVMRLQSDPELDKKVQITLPRMSFEMKGMTYDSSRKQITNIKNFAPSGNADTIQSQYNPVPYDFDFDLYIYVRNIEDGTQIIERILPFFTPDYSIKLNLIPEMGIVKEIPVILKSTSHEIDYEGDRDHETRTVIWTLSFTVKGFVFGPVSEGSIIKTSITSIFDNTLSDGDTVGFKMVTGGLGTYQEGEYVYQGFSLNNSTASAKVIAWSPSTLTLKLGSLSGDFISGKPIYGAQTGAVYSFNTFQIEPQELVKYTVVPNPTTANANSDYTYTTTIEEFPNIE
jgi:T4-like virus Myoviridae tail sheath stabiliser